MGIPFSASSRLAGGMLVVGQAKGRVDAWGAEGLQAEGMIEKSRRWEGHTFVIFMDEYTDEDNQGNDDNSSDHASSDPAC
jgi:hypothetical protein